MKPGDALGPYEVIEAGYDDGLGALWLAQDTDGLLVHVEIYPPDDPSFAPDERLTVDLQVAGGLRHANLVRIVAAGRAPQGTYVASEFVEGLRLPALVEGLRRAGRAVPPWVAAYIMHGLATALRCIHGHIGPDGRPLGTVGRTLHPHNVVLTRTGGIKLAALPSVGPVRPVSNSERIGPYQSPEVLDAAPMDARSDLFGLGIIIWELLADRPLFRGIPEPQRGQAIRIADVPPLPDTVPEFLVAVTMRCLARRPEDRLPNAEHLVGVLNEALRQHPEASADMTRRLVALAASHVARPRPQTAVLDKVEPETPEPSPARGPEAPPRQGSSRRRNDPFFDAVRDAGGITSRRFEVLGRLGSGGMGEVYRVRDRELNEVVALKMLPRSGPQEPKSLDRLRREVRLARQIASDNVCRIYDIVDLGDGARGLTMAVVEGATLSQMMKAGLPLDYARFARWGADVAAGLAAAHQLSIVHRDLKPENVMVRHEDDRAVVLDFGIARQQREAATVDAQLTQQGIIMGTPRYMSPEQLANGPLDGRSDLYALGLILAELVTGQVPRLGDDYARLLKRRAVAPEPYDLGAEAPGAPQPFVEIVNHLLMSAADDRPPSAAVISDALAVFAEKASSAPSAEVALEQPPQPHPLRVPLMMVTAAAAIVVISLLIVGGPDRPAPIAEPESADAADTSPPTIAVPEATQRPDVGVAPPEETTVRRRRKKIPEPEEM